MCRFLAIFCLLPVLAFGQRPTTDYPTLKFDPSSGAFVPATTHGHTIGSGGNLSLTGTTPSGGEIAIWADASHLRIATAAEVPVFTDDGTTFISGFDGTAHVFKRFLLDSSLSLVDSGSDKLLSVDLSNYLTVSGDGSAVTFGGNVYSSTAFGTSLDLSGNSSITSGAPANATYITQTANGTLGAEQALASLSTGLMKVTTTTGVVSSIVEGTGIETALGNGFGATTTTFARGDKGVTSLVLSYPSIFYIPDFTNTAGAWASTLNVSNQLANTVWAGPSSGSATTPSFRSLVAADITGIPTIASTSLLLKGNGSGNAIAATPGDITDGVASLLVKPAVAVVATANLTLSGEQTIDGQLTSTSLVLATAQSTGSQNGPWVSASGSWTRPTWYTNGSTTQAPQFLTTFVRLGTTYQGSTWRMTTASVTVDTTATTWVQTPTNLNSVIGTIAESSVTNLTSDLALKAPLASPTFTGTPLAPTATGGTNTTQIATTAFVTSAVSGGSGLTIGTTGITSGTGTRLLYETSGNKVGEISGATSDGTTLTLVAPVLGTPASGIVTNLTGTASININGTVGATTPAAGTFTTLVAGSATSLLLGTAGSAVGNIGFRNATSGTATLAPPTGALGTYSVTLPNAASTLPIIGQQITVSGPTAARTWTAPDASFTIARTDAANTFTGNQTFTTDDAVLSLFATTANTGLIIARSNSLNTQTLVINNSSGSGTFTSRAGASAGSFVFNTRVSDTTNTARLSIAFNAVTDIGMASTTVLGFSSTTAATGTIDTAFARNGAGVVEVNSGTAGTYRDVKVRAMIPAGTDVTCTGGTIGTGSKNHAGFVTATTTGTSTIVITFTVTAPTGWNVSASDSTAVTNLVQTASTTTTATLSGTTVTSDVIRYIAMPY